LLRHPLLVMRPSSHRKPLARRMIEQGGSNSIPGRDNSVQRKIFHFTPAHTPQERSFALPL